MLYPQENQCRETKKLSGLWDFRLDPAEQGEGQSWHAGFAEERLIAVPCSWNDQFQDLKSYFGSGWYQTRFHLPRGWEGQRVWVRFGSANYWADVWVNGIKVGSHVGGHLPFEFDITDLLYHGDENGLVVRVNGQLSLETVPWGMVPDSDVPRSAEQYPDINFDFFPYCGLHRPVILYSTPRVFIRDIRAHTTLEGSGATLHVEVSGDLPEGTGLRFKLHASGKASTVAPQSVASASDGVIRCELEIADPRLWCPQDPYLYDLRVGIFDGDQIVDEYRLPVGLRTVTIQGGQLLLNNRPIFLKGFGKHEDFPVVGRGLCLPATVKDFELLRWVGANSFRTAHYPHAEEVLQLADRQGMLVSAEASAPALFFGRGTTQRLAVCRQQLQELIARDKNHPSVIMWSVADEPDSDVPQAAPFMKELADLAHELDDTRPVTFASHKGMVDEAIGYFDVICLNRYYAWYSEPGQLDRACQLLSEEMDALHTKYGKPFLLGECGADAVPGVHTHPPELFSEEFQVELIRRYHEVVCSKPYAIGTHIWCLADFKTAQTFRRVGGINYKGVFTRDRQPKMAAHMLRKLWNRGEGGDD